MNRNSRKLISCLITGLNLLRATKGENHVFQRISGQNSGLAEIETRCEAKE
ncbi:hypothetical protein METH_09595 [Leisingera methylohalidivorans DSM 14336]|uniref:Uncharacterized protein n=1 Tax=Leisingera methylohalidivorans DSM 14336 TaxID=999552 RepID=V9VYL8_9RHOB|nr:hypothetical protein METH_09595 [Leisingera methylohalidivorans DSM 14336]